MAKDKRDSSTGLPVRRYLVALKQSDIWWFCLFYSVTFGGYVGLSGFLPIFFRDQYGVRPTTAGYLTALAAFVGSGVRPLGGYFADKFGGARMLSVLLFGIGAAYALSSRLPGIESMITILVLGMACLGMGNGAVFQMVPRRFPHQIGIATGVVGAIGGLGGFFLPNLLGSIKQASGSFSAGFIVLATMAIGSVLLLQFVLSTRQGIAAVPLTAESQVSD